MQKWCACAVAGTIVGFAEYAFETETTSGHIRNTHYWTHCYGVFEMHFRYPPNTRAVAPFALFRAFHRALINWAKHTRLFLGSDSTTIAEPFTFRNFEDAVTGLGGNVNI